MFYIYVVLSRPSRNTIMGRCYTVRPGSEGTLPTWGASAWVLLSLCSRRSENNFCRKARRSSRDDETGPENALCYIIGGSKAIRINLLFQKSYFIIFWGRVGMKRDLDLVSVVWRAIVKKAPSFAHLVQLVWSMIQNAEKTMMKGSTSVLINWIFHRILYFR